VVSGLKIGGNEMLRKITLVAAVAAALLLPVPAFAGHGHGGWHGGHG